MTEKNIEKSVKQEKMKKFLKTKTLTDAEQTMLNDQLLDAADYGDLKTVQSCLDAGADVNAKDKYGETPLIKVIDNKKLIIVEFLLTKGADVNAMDNEGRTALTIVAYDGDINMAEVLLTKGADVNAMDKNGLTALDSAKNMRWYRLSVDYAVIEKMKELFKKYQK